MLTYAFDELYKGGADKPKAQLTKQKFAGKRNKIE
jgi:hypothetical protein